MIRFSKEKVLLLHQILAEAAGRQHDKVAKRAELCYTP